MKIILSEDHLISCKCPEWMYKDRGLMSELGLTLIRKQFNYIIRGEVDRASAQRGEGRRFDARTASY